LAILILFAEAIRLQERPAQDDGVHVHRAGPVFVEPDLSMAQGDLIPAVVPLAF
jgi:hypothetical protein